VPRSKPSLPAAGELSVLLLARSLKAARGFNESGRVVSFALFKPFRLRRQNYSRFITTFSRVKPLHNGLFAFAGVLLRGEIGRCEAVGNENMKRKKQKRMISFAEAKRKE
jgi:hypothetical protein